MKSRRTFLKLSALSSTAVITNPILVTANENGEFTSTQNLLKQVKPIVVSTWNHGLEANEASWKILSNGGTALDAVEAGVRVTESDPNNSSVGLGGLPDRDGFVTLDACIMDETHNCGSVAFLQDIENPISVARKVME
ncbi:MAG: isoaspartyl peptidase/L-asparaginase, partial [Flavobacteriaceae bacterium]|nr:isoaspartyl peptidase/L-asparaginase [Flavobacteriaceae bacterium]